jgi:hypothetical protein
VVCVKERRANKASIWKLNLRQVSLSSSKTEKTGCLEIIHKLTDFSKKGKLRGY